MNVTPPRDGELFVSALGGTEVDLSQVQLPESLRLAAVACMGVVKIIVPAGTEVKFRGLSFMGGRGYKRLLAHGVREHHTRLKLMGIAIMGGIEVVEAPS